MSSKLAKLGLSAVLAYGLFDGVTYTSFFVLAFLGYDKSTGKNPAANLQALLGVRNASICYCFSSFVNFRVRKGLIQVYNHSCVSPYGSLSHIQLGSG